MSFLLSFFHWTICLTQVIWTQTEIDVPVFDNLDDYINIPEATLYIDGKQMSDVATYQRDGVNRTFISTIVTSYVKTYYIYYEAYFPNYDTKHKQLIQFRVIDDEKPEITYIPAYTIEVFGEPPDFYKNLKYHDNYDDEEVLDVVVDDQYVNINQVGTYDVLYFITDQSGNVNEYKQTLKIVDRTIPQIELLKPLVVEVYQKIDIQEFFKITDNYDLNVKVDIKDHKTSFDRLGYEEITIVATDSSNNIVTKTFSIEVIDSSAPELILVSYPKPLHVNDDLDQDFGYEFILSLTDNYDDLSIQDVNISHDIDIYRVGQYKIYYEITDDSGNQSKKILEVEVKDLIGPSIEITEPLIFEVFSYAPILSELFVVTDNYCELSAIDVKYDAKINMNLIGFYEFNITALDCFDNPSKLTTVIEVIDQIPPNITQISDIIITDFESKNLEIYFNAYDLYDSDDTWIEVDDQLVIYGHIGSYEITVYAYDQSGNQAQFDTNIIIIDINPPVLELKEEMIYIDINQPYIDLKSYIDVASDNHSNLTIEDVEIFQDIVPTKIGKYSIIYKLVDESLNQTIQTIDLFVVDLEPPNIKGYALYVDMFDQVNLMEGIDVNDNVDIYEIYTSVDFIDTSYPGTYEVKYVVIDTSGNQSMLKRMIYISEGTQTFSIKDFTPMIVILFISVSALYYLYKKL